MVLLSCSDEEGVAYVETKNLDGETNLKNKYVNKDLFIEMSNERTADLKEQCKILKNFYPVMNLEGPNNLIYKFDANMTFEKTTDSSTPQRKTLSVEDIDSNKTTVPLSNDNVCLRGMSLKNTEWILGVVVYTGHQTKI